MKKTLFLFLTFLFFGLTQAQAQVNTLTPTGTITPINTPTVTNTVTSTPTGCGKTGGSNDGVLVNPVSAGTTVVGLYFNIHLCCTTSCGASYPVFTAFIMALSMTGNLSTEIQQVQLWTGTTLLSVTSPSSGVTFSGFSSTSAAYQVRFVLSPSASGTVDTSMSQNGSPFNGYLINANSPNSALWVEPGYFYVDSGVLVVGSSTPTWTPTPTYSWTPTPVNTDTFTPTSTYTSTVTPTNTWTPTTTAFTDTPTSVISAGTATIGPTETFTETPTDTPAFTGTNIGSPYPNPLLGTGVFHIPIQAPGSGTAEMKVYTIAYRKVAAVSKSFSRNTDLTWDLKDDKGNPASSGVYYLRLKVTAGSLKTTKMVKVLILR